MKAQVYTPESLLRLSSLADSPAAHIRAWPSPAIGFPLHPLIYWRVPIPQIEEIRDILWWTPSPDGLRELQLPIDWTGSTARSSPSCATRAAATSRPGGAGWPWTSPIPTCR